MERDKKQKRSSNKIFYLIQSCLLFAQNLSFQFLPILARKQGASEQQMGLLTAVQNVTSTFFSPFWGKKSDAMGRKIFLLLGGFIALSSTIVIAVADTANQIIFAVGINAFGLSIITPAWSGAIADHTESRSRGGFMGRMVGFGWAYVTIALILYALISPSLSVSEIAQYRIIIWLSAINFGLVIIFSWFLIDLRHSNRIKRSDSIFTPLEDPIFRRFLIVLLIWWFFMSLAWSMFPIVVADVIEATPAEVAWIGIVGTISQSFFSYTLADYIDNVGVRKSLILGFIPFSIVPVLYAISTEWWHLIPAQIIAGIGIGFGFTSMQAYILNMAGEERAGNYMGSFNIFFGLVTFIGSLAGGIFLGWFKDYKGGDLAEALTTTLFFIFFFRVLTNLIMVKFLPHPTVLD